jgi:hypothetical protein
MIKAKLDQLAEFEAQKDASRLAMQEAIDEIYTPEIKAQVDAVEQEFSGRDEAVDEKIKVLRKEIKPLGVEAGETVKGKHYMSVYTGSKPKIKRGGIEGLLGLAKLVPEIMDYIEYTEPIISIRRR